MVPDVDAPAEATDGPSVPAYGPVDAVLGYALFYVVVDRVTPTVTATFAGVLSVPPSTVGLGLAAALWFVLATTAFDQLRRQLAALGVGTADAVRRETARSGTLSEPQTEFYLAALLVGGVVAVWTFDTAMRSLPALIRVVGTLDPGAFVPREFLTVATFFVAFAVATHALDRLVVGAVRQWLAD
ncbi:hypothetical protein DVK02_06210 [Halobellus sp. Atlit-31R]|nr:hypothetical protein DVK02_06210 [Halobellus sp. Atlit-31R]